MVAGQHDELEWTSGLLAPWFEPLTTHFVVRQTSEDNQRAVQWWLLDIFVTLCHLEVSTHQRQDDLQKLRMLEHLGGRTVETTQLFDELVVRQIVSLHAFARQLWRA